MNEITDLAELRRKCLRCRRCTIGGCYHEEKYVKNVFSSGTEAANIMIVGLNPHTPEIIVGEPFKDIAGDYFDEVIYRILGINRSELYITNLVKCGMDTKRVPNGYEINTCQSYLKDELTIVKPKVVVALGKTVLKHLTGANGIKRHRGQFIFSPKYKVQVLATYHPSNAVLMDKEKQKQFCSDIAQLNDYL